MEKNSKKLWIALGVVAVIVLIIVLVSQSKKANVPTGDQTNVPVETTTTTPEAAAPTAPIVAPEIIKESRVEAPGASVITKDNKVVTTEGRVTVNNVSQNSVSAPQQSLAIKKSQVAPSAVKIDVSVAAGYVPNTFTVKPGAPVTVALTSVDQYAHLFSFKDSSLSAIGLGVYAGETKAVTFNAPTTPGTYTFFSNMPSQAASEVGTMIVK
jgi:plastocyanin